MSLLTLLRGAALIGAFIWTTYLVAGWWAYGEMKSFSMFPGITQKAQNALLIQTGVVIALYVFGFFGKSISQSFESTKEENNLSNDAITNESNNNSFNTSPINTFKDNATETRIDTRVCPFCAETIKAAAIKCRFCLSSVEPTDNIGHSSNDLVVSTSSLLSETSKPVSSGVDIPPSKIDVATCPECNGFITLDTEACNHCNTWLGAGSDLKPKIVTAESKSDIPNNISLGSSVSKEFETLAIVEELRAEKRVNPTTSKNNNLKYVIGILIFLTVVIYFYRTEINTKIESLSLSSSATHLKDYSKSVCSDCEFHGAIRVTKLATESGVDSASKRILTDKLLDTLPAKNRILRKYKTSDGSWYLEVGNFTTTEQAEAFVKKLKPYGVDAWVGVIGG